MSIKKIFALYKKLRFFFHLSLFIRVFYLCSKWCNTQTDRFTLLKTETTPFYDALWDFPFPEKEEVAPILDQPFSYLSSGGQSFVFLSEDGHYVLKLIKNHFRGVIPPLAPLVV
jgi:hypothetical protein